MPIYRLEPIDLSAPNWAASTYKGPVIVRAPTEGGARKQAYDAFGNARSRPLGEPVPFPPWECEYLVRAVEIEDSRFSPDGEPEILDPPHGELNLR